MPNLSHIQGIIWDLDDTLYSVGPALHKSMRESIAKTVVDMGKPITYDEALKLAIKSQNTHRLTAKILLEKFEIPAQDIHLPFHANMDHNVTEACPDLPATFEKNPHLQHVIMTHASRDWALRMLDHLGIADFFKPECVLGLEDINFEKKEDSDRACKTSLSLMGLDAKNTLFAEDRAWNLTIPHDLGMTTALIHHPSQEETYPQYVHHRFQRAADLLNQVALTKS